MSSPTINRWGLNLFWYRFWYNDRTNHLLVNQDSLINQLIRTYIHYGAFHYKPTFLNSYFLTNIVINFKMFFHEQNLKYFRMMEYRNRRTGERGVYKARSGTKNLYYSKLWILRYQNWLVINIYFFQPPKSRHNIVQKPNKTLNSLLLEKSNNNATVFTRKKLIYMYIINLIISKNIYYKF